MNAQVFDLLKETHVAFPSLTKQTYFYCPMDVGFLFPLVFLVLPHPLVPDLRYALKIVGYQRMLGLSLCSLLVWSSLWYLYRSGSVLANVA